MNLSVAVMAHPSRERFVTELLPHLPGARVVWDQRNDRWDTGRRSMLARDPDADWHLVVQDDAVLCRDFLPGVQRALDAVPGNPVAFYTGKVRPHHNFVRRTVKRAQMAGKSWIAMDGPWWGVACAVPAELVEPMVLWCDERPDVANYDRRMALYWHAIGRLCWYSLPSLVNHRVGPDNPSLVPGRGSALGRTAAAYIGDDVSPLDVDWSTGALRANVTGFTTTVSRRPRPPASRSVAGSTQPAAPVGDPGHAPTRRPRIAQGLATFRRPEPPDTR